MNFFFKYSGKVSIIQISLGLLVWLEPKKDTMIVDNFCKEKRASLLKNVCLARSDKATFQDTFLLGNLNTYDLTLVFFYKFGKIIAKLNWLINKKSLPFNEKKILLLNISIIRLCWESILNIYCRFCRVSCPNIGRLYRQIAMIFWCMTWYLSSFVLNFHCFHFIFECKPFI